MISRLYLTERHRGIYAIPYRAIVPHREECTNLIVPVCWPASHIAMTSLRMEPVWMILGGSAGIAAAVAARRPVQDLDYATMLRPKVIAAKQRLDRPARTAEMMRRGRDPGRTRSRDPEQP